MLSDSQCFICRNMKMQDGTPNRNASAYLGAVLLIIIGVGVLELAALERMEKCDSSSNRASEQSLACPFDEANMFFGLTILKEPRDYGLARELNVSWVSMQPVVIWANMESSPGQYNWTRLDREIAALQYLGLDCSVVLIPMNAFGEKRAELAEYLQNQTVDSFLRTPESAALMLYPNNETLPVWIDFVKAIVDRYDGDSVNDMPNLTYPVRNWHFSEEYPEFYIPADVYVDLLKVTYPAIKQTDPQAKVILHGIASNILQRIAFAAGFIDDPDAGFMDGILYTRAQMAADPGFRSTLRDVESFLEDGKGYYDVVDVHLYEPKETFMKGKIACVKSALQQLGVDVPIWCIEGGGPFKLKEGQQSQHGDAYWGEYTDKENAEFVVKMHSMAAACGLERFHWGLSATDENDYWNGPWNNMALTTSEREKKPAFYTFAVLLERLRDFKKASDLSTSDMNLYEFEVGSRLVYVGWTTTNSIVDLSQEPSIGKTQLRITHIVTELDGSGGPVQVADEIQPSTSVSLSNTPVIMEDTRQAGVSVGDWWRYTTNFTWLGSPYSDPWIDLASNSEWAQHAVLDVSGRNVTFQVLVHFKNGTETTIIDKIDLATGFSNASDSMLICPCLAVARNLTVGEPIYTESPYDEWTVSAVEPRVYAGQTIETSFINASNSGIQLYYARDTGVLCAFQRTEAGKYILNLEVTQGSPIPELPSFPVLMLIISSTVSALAVYRQRRRSHSRLCIPRVDVSF